MKLPIKKKYFDEIKAGKKQVEYRDAHITFVCEETGEQLRKKVTWVNLTWKHGASFPKELRDSPLFEDDDIIAFHLKQE